MRHLVIKAVEEEYYRPVVDFNPETGVCEMSGESYLEQVDEFFRPLTDWLSEFTQSNPKSLTFNFRLSYYNTSSSKKILEILKILSEFAQADNTLTINWFYEPTDADLIEDADDFMMITGLRFNLIKKERKESKKIL